MRLPPLPRRLPPDLIPQPCGSEHHSQGCVCHILMCVVKRVCVHVYSCVSGALWMF